MWLALRPPRSWPAAVGLAACAAGCGAPSDPQDSARDTDPADVTPWAYESDPAPVAELDAATFGPALAEALSVVPTLDPALAFAAYTNAAARSDGVCPAYDPAWGLPFRYWEDDCETTGDEAFYGWVLAREARDMPNGSARCDSFFHFGFARIGPADAVRWTGWGELASDACRDEGAGEQRHTATLKGDFRSDSAPGTWLADALTLNLAVDAMDTRAGRAITLTGGVSGLAGGLPAVWLRTLSLTEAAGVCNAEPTGSLLAWDRAGVGYVLTFDEVEASDPACDGCGALTIGDTPAGEVCLDLSGLLAWPTP